MKMNYIFNRGDSDRTRGKVKRVKKRRVKMVVRQGTFTQRVVNAWKDSGSRNGR